jgi:SAM-dependent methyltransferase
MKYKVSAAVGKKEAGGGDTWRAESFDERLRLTEHQTSYRFFKAYVPPCTVLEVGCGIGGWLIPLRDSGYTVCGLELELDALKEIGRHQASGLRLTNGSLFSMPFKSGSFDALTSLGVLEHFEDESMVHTALREHHRVLKEDGTFFITVPLFNLFRAMFHLPKRLLVTLIRRLSGKQEYFYEYRYSEKEFGRLLERNNFTITRVIYDDCVPPYNIGLWVDFKMFQEGREPFLSNKRGVRLFTLLSRIHPKLVSGAVGFLCKKRVAA